MDGIEKRRGGRLSPYADKDKQKFRLILFILHGFSLLFLHFPAFGAADGHFAAIIDASVLLINDNAELADREKVVE